MPCYHPITAYQGADGRVVFVERAKHDLVRSLLLPCGQCRGCRLERSRQWAIRCVHEASLHERNCFITLTYDDGHLPEDRSLDYKIFQVFMRRLRKRFKEFRIRFFMCGEYGETLGRPHYHACLFGFDFPDKVFHKRVASGFNLYRSDSLDSLWGRGFASIGDVSFESAAYVARYVMKKRNGDGQTKYYEIIDLDTGEVARRRKEFCMMSLKPGIGSDWLRLFWRDVVFDGQVVINGVKSNVPRFYMRRLRKLQAWETVEFERDKYARAHWQDSTDSRLAVREAVAEARVSRLKRTI